MFPEMEYLPWFGEQMQGVDHDLGNSGLLVPEWDDDSLVPEAVADTPPLPDGTTAFDLVADQYRGVGPDEVQVTAGAAHANVLALIVAAERSGAGDSPTVLVEDPGYEPLVRTPQGFGATVDRFPRRADDYGVDLDDLQAALTDRTALVSITNRHNPSGRLLDRDELRAVAEVVADAGAHLLVDEVYAPYVPAGDTDPSGAFDGPTAAGLPNTVVTQSFSKFLGLGVVRFGWMVAGEAFVETVRNRTLHFPSGSPVDGRMGARVLNDVERFADQSRDRLAANHDLLDAFVADRDDLVGTVPPGNSFAFLGHRDADGQAVSEAARDRGVFVSPGRFYGAPERFRICLGHAPADMEAALDTFGRALDTL